MDGDMIRFSGKIMRKKSSLIKFIRLWGITFLIAVGAIIIILDIIVSYRDFSVRAEQIRADYIVQQKTLIKHEVDRVIAMIHHEKAQSEIITKAKIKSRVYEAYAIAQHIYQQNKAAKSQGEIQQMIVDALRPIRFEDGSGYYFATRLDGVEILFADKPELEGLNLLSLQDTHGQYVVKEIIEIVQKSGEGFYKYHWTKPDAKGRDFKKISFVKRFEPFDWLIGTGLYVDDIETSIKKRLMGQINKIRFGVNGYLFVNTWQGISLAHGLQPDLIGTNMWETEDSKGNKTIQMLVAAAKKEEGGYVSYWWRKSSAIEESPKIAYAKSIPDWEIFVGSGVYLDDVETDIVVMQAKLNNQIKTKLFSFALVVIVVIAFVLFSFNRLTRRIKNDFNLFISFFNQATHSNEEINRDKVHFIELDQMAQDANQMLQDKIFARQELMDERERLKQSEHFLNSIFESIQDGISILNLDLTIRHTNSVMKKWYTANSPLEGKKCFICYQNGDQPCDPCPTLRCFETVQTEVDIVPGPFDSGEVKWIELFSYPIKDPESGEITGAVEFVRDITQQKIAEEELQKMDKLKSIGTLAGGIAHDFNNILMGLFGNISLAKEGLEQDHPAFKPLEEAESAMNRAIRLTRQLLTFAKGGEPVKKNVTLGTLVEEIVRFDLSGSNVKPVFEQKADLWLAEVDKGQIQQVFSNLTINANQAMPDGGHLYITLKNEELSDKALAGLTPGKYIKVIVRDEGAGIEQRYLERIFDPYFTTKQTGSGLGLATVYSVVKKHGGRISVDSKLGQGSIFTLYLPASKARQLPQISPVTDKSSSSPQSARVLIMDDEKMIRNLLAKMLERIGYEVDATNDGKKAIAMYQQALDSKKPFDLVIMDLTIPGGMGGEETIKEIITFDPEVKAIISSGYADDRIMANYAKYGFKDIVSKPYSISQLREVLNRVLEG
jgi:PAS domain S-box-containing protein